MGAVDGADALEPVVDADCPFSENGGEDGVVAGLIVGRWTPFAVVAEADVLEGQDGDDEGGLVVELLCGQ